MILGCVMISKRRQIIVSNTFQLITIISKFLHSDLGSIPELESDSIQGTELELPAAEWLIMEF